jgi:carboxypeptidase C (cathepsin A)
MKRFLYPLLQVVFAALLALNLSSRPTAAAETNADTSGPTRGARSTPGSFEPEERTTTGTVTIAGQRIEYRAVAGTLVVHAKDWDDVPANSPANTPASCPGNPSKEGSSAQPEASIFYVAYFKSVDRGTKRPLTFLFNGGPGSSSIWLHMGSFGPRRVLTADGSHTPAAPYALANNEFSLLDASDLVFVDAPGTGFSSISGSDREKAFYGVDQDAQAFVAFIVQFLGKYERWNAPKYLFGESYGTARSAVVANLLETERSIDLNGVILLAQILNFDNRNDGEEFNPGVDLPYELVLPTYAAAAWYHHKLPESAPNLPALLTEVEHFAMTDFSAALSAGARLDVEQRHAVATKLHQYTGLSTEYIEKADLRVAGAQFQQRLMESSGQTIGRLDARFIGPAMDVRSRDADYDPFQAATQSAYIATFNDYVKRDLKFDQGREYKPVADFDAKWNFQHQPPGASVPLPRTTNVMPDLATAMKYNPQLKILVNAGYYDLATPFYESIYEMEHLAIPPELRDNIAFRFYESGHMAYVHSAALQALHDNVAAFIRQTSRSSLP